MAANDRSNAEIAQLQARVSTLEQLLEVYERSVLEQSERLYAEQERLRLQTTLLESQGEASLEGVLSVSVDGRILFANRQLAQMWGVDRPVIGAKAYRETLRSMAERSADPDGFFERTAAVGDERESSQEIALADGRTFDSYTAPIRSQEGQLLGRVWHFREITALKEIGRMKDEFISAVSHELRTPLTSIRGSLDLMANGVMGSLSTESMTLAKIAQANCQRLVRLVDDVLDVEKIEAGQLALRLEVIGLESVVEQAIESMRPFGAARCVDFQIESSIQGARVNADSDRLIQVMENLLSNAAKYSQDGATVLVRLSRRGARLRVAVTDWGSGIAPELHGQVFERFAQIDTPAARKAEGTGLGLNIARGIVTRLGGTIDFESEPGAGSTFHFDLPEWEPGESAEVAR